MDIYGQTLSQGMAGGLVGLFLEIVVDFLMQELR